MRLPASTLVALLVSAAIQAVAVADDAPQPAISHRNLRVYQDATGEHLIKTPADWAKRRAACLEGMQQAMGKLPDRSKLPPLDVQISETFEAPTFTRYKLSFAADQGDRVPCYLFVPKGLAGKRVPGILALHQTTPLGKMEPAGLGPNENKHYGLELAKRGYVVLVPDYPSFGDYKDYDFNADTYTSGSMKGIFNHMRATCCKADRRSIPSALAPSAIR
jgi:hypothetical protein